MYWLSLVCRPAGCCLFSCIAIVRLSPCRSYLFSCIAIDMLALYFPAGDIALCRACYRWSVALLGAFIQIYCYRYASSLYPCWRYCTLSSVLSLVCRPAVSYLFRSIAIALLALYWLSLVLHSVGRAIVRLSPCRSCLFSGIAIVLLALYLPAGDIALCRACYRPSIALQELSIQRYCYRSASSLLAIVGLHSVEPAIVRLSPCRSCLFSGIAIDMLALYWLALVCTLSSLLSSVCRPAGCCLFRSIAIDMLALYWLALVLHSVERAIVGLSFCRSCLFSGIAIDMLALYSEVLLSPCWLSISLLVILHSVERAIVSLSPCWVCLFRCIAIALLALYIPAGDIAPCRACYRWSIALLALYFPAGDIALCRACYRWSVVLQGASIQLYCYRYASSLLASVGLHSVEPAIVGLSSCRSCLFSGIAIDMLALYIPASDIALCRACYRWSVEPAGAVYSAVLLSIC